MRQLLMGIYTVLQQIPEGPGVSSRATFFLDIYPFIYIYLVLTYENITMHIVLCVLLWIYFLIIISINLSQICV